VSATGNASIANHVQLVAHGIYDFGELIERSPRPVKLTSAMIGNHDSGGADVQSTPRVRNTHNPGFGVRWPSKAMPAASFTWGSCTRKAMAYPRATQKHSSGIA
jgi:hypothetical protein